jgi:hypothetical protein
MLLPESTFHVVVEPMLNEKKRDAADAEKARIS